MTSRYLVRKHILFHQKNKNCISNMILRFGAEPFVEDYIVEDRTLLIRPQFDQYIFVLLTR